MRGDEGGWLTEEKRNSRRGGAFPRWKVTVRVEVTITLEHFPALVTRARVLKAYVWLL